MAVRPRSRGRGQHFLRSSKLAAELVRAAGVQPGDLVLDLGAGTGVLTAALLRLTQRVIAVELDERLVGDLRRRFPGTDVVSGDARQIALPREPFKVVANLPFDGATTILRRLLDPRAALVTADVIVDWNVAVKRAAVWPTTELSAYWSAWFELSVVRRLPRSVFAPPPAVDAAVLRAVRRQEPLVPTTRRREYQRFLARAYRQGPRAVLPPRVLKQWESELGFERRAAARDLDGEQWASLFTHAVRRAL